MNRCTWVLTAALLGTNVVLVQPAIAAKSAAEVQAIARAITVEIRLQEDSSVGSGIIVARQGDLYTVATNRHVICGQGSRNKVPEGETYELGMADGQKYRVKAASVKLIGTDLDLAIAQFRSSRNYPVAQLGSAGGLKVANVVYTAGFPLAQPGFSFNQGGVIAVVDKRIEGDRGGYSMIYDAATLPGMSGGGVFDGNGLLVAIHGQGERFGENTELDNKSQVGSKIGYNRGIPIRWILQDLASVGINISENPLPSTFTTIKSQVAVSADEYFIAGFNKFVEPGADVVAGKRVAIQELDKAIQINSRYTFAYFYRAYIYEQLQKFQQSLSDYDRVITLNPRFGNAYNNRGLLKKNKLNDSQGALADFNQAINLNPKDVLAYNNRGILKKDELNDSQGALADFNQAITLNPKDALAYGNRGNLKEDKLNDSQGALADYNKAITLNSKDARAYYNRGILKYEKLNDSQGALSDYNQAITLNPQYANAYNNRGLLKKNKLNDSQGALADFNQAINLNPKYALAYGNRGNLKKDKLNDIQGALADYNQAISLNPKYAPTHSNRGILKYLKLNDKAGAIQDFRQAAKLFRAQGQTQNFQKVLGMLGQLGATE
jgi:tetratricopeptide (TPR) repeat protein/S1-C subfamily serine protease